MIALLLAAQVAGAPPALTASPESFAFRGRACGLWEAKPVRRDAPAPQARRLIDLPPANLEIPVLRLGPDGCSQAVVVRYQVEGDGRFAAPSAGGGK